MPLRIYFEDTDAGGIVYHANYFRHAERARAEMMRTVGLESRHLWEKEDRIFAIRHAEIDYLAPAYLDDALEVESEILEMRGSSMTARQCVKREGRMLVEMNIVLVCLTGEGKPVRIPDHVRDRLGAFVATVGAGGTEEKG
jgi:acyl-CoA thioester hydrolase